MPVSKIQFDSILLSHSKPVTLSFFSTWCADCKVEIEKIKNSANTANFILIAEFDSLERVNHNLNKMNVATECYFDTEGKIKEYYRIKVVPTEVELK